MSRQVPKRIIRTLVVGGYGRLGSHVARGLVKRLGHHVAIAGRNRDTARSFADGEGLLMSDRRIDVDNPASFSGNLEQIDLIINCADHRTQPHLADAAVAGGLAYVDLTCDYEVHARIIALEDRAKETGARLIVGGGLSPGLINLLARSAAGAVDQPQVLHSFTHMGLGPNSSQTRLRQLSDFTRRFPVMEGQYADATVNYAQSCRARFPSPVGPRQAYRFALPDQFFFPDTLGVPNCASWLSLQPPRLGKVLQGLARTGIGRLAGKQPLNRLSGRLAERMVRQSDEDRWMLMVEAVGKRATHRVTATGDRGVEQAAAGFAVELARRLMAGAQLKPGVWLPEEVLKLDAFIKPLAAGGCRICAEDLPHADKAEAG